MNLKTGTIFIFFFWGFILFARGKEIEPMQIVSIDNGLGHNGVTSICEDSHGYLWFGTYDGLNRYDGYGVKVFKNTPSKKIFVSNRIRAVVEDKNGNLWLGTDEGIAIYQYTQERFKNLFSNSIAGKNVNGPVIRDILISSSTDKIISITEKEGILVFNSDYTFEYQVFPPEEFLNHPIEFYEGVAVDAYNYLFTTNAGLLLFNLKTNRFTQYLPEEIGQNNAVVKLTEHEWLVTCLNRIVIVKYEKTNAGADLRIVPVNTDNNRYRKAAADDFGKIWLSVENIGIVQIDKAALLKKHEAKVVSTYFRERGMYRTSRIFISKLTGCWVATFDKGVYRFNLSENPFLSYNNHINRGLGDNASRIGHLNALDKDRLLISAQDEGLTVYNTFTHMTEELPDFLKRWNSPDISVPFIDSRKNIWLRFNNKLGICRILAGNHALENIQDNFDQLSKIEALRSVVEDKYSGDIWLLGVNNVFKVNINEIGEIIDVEELKNNSFFDNRDISLFRSIYADSENGYVWIGTSTDGLLRVNTANIHALEDAAIDQYLHDPGNRFSVASNFISCIERFSNGELWLGTERGGICKVINSSDDNLEFINFSEDDGLSNNVVKAIISDRENNLWISTNIGLNRFDIHKNEIRIFKKNDGLPFEDFYYSTVTMDNGYLVFSGLDRLCYFNPQAVPQDEKLPKLDFRNFKLFNRLVMPGDTIKKRVLLTTRLANTNEIHLKYNENVFSLEVTSLHYSSPKNHYLRYKFAPVNNEWVVVTSDQYTITQSGLSPGEYELSVMASNSLNEWTAPKTLKIIISPPVWKTVPAYISYVLLFVLIVCSVIFYVLRLNRLKHELEIESLETENVKAVNAAKLRFFSNISHEIKTPLTLISGPVEILATRYKGNTELAEKLQIVRRQSKKIWQLVDQVHDFQRSDASELKMNYSQFCFNSFINDLAGDFYFYADTERKEFKVDYPDESVFVSADQDKLEKILNNLLNNAFKYTRSGDHVTVTFHAHGNNLVIEVADSGRGIAADDLPHIFERFYQSQHKHSEYIGGAGIGLAFTKRLVEMHYGDIVAQSVLGKGTTIIVRLPIAVSKPESTETEVENKVLSTERDFDEKKQVAEKLDVDKIQTDRKFAEATIFIAEDNTEMRSFIGCTLSHFFNVKSFRNGQDLVDVLTEEWPDLIVSDVLMPEMNGFELCKFVKSDIKTSHIPVVLLTACTTIDEQLKGFKFGADSYITKPFEIQHLIVRIENLLQNKQRLSERYRIDFPRTLEKSNNSEKDMAFLERLYKLLEENLDNTDLDMDKLAKKLYLNRTHFYQKVKAITNETPYELLKMYRLKRAAELLVQKQLSVNEVYAMTGFKSRSNFSKLFKEKYGTTPGKYASEALKKLQP